MSTSKENINIYAPGAIFPGYTLVKLEIDKQEKEGKQAKEPLSGMYRDADGNLVFIKASTTNTDDDDTEPLASRIFRGPSPDGETQSIQYNYIKTVLDGTHQTKEKKEISSRIGTVYIMSTARKDHMSLKEAVEKRDKKVIEDAEARGDKALAESIKKIKRFKTVEFLFGKIKIVTSVPTEETKILMYNILTPLERKDLAKTLAGCVLAGEYDCQPGNISLYTAKDRQRRAAKFDNGWALTNLCKEGSETVNAFERKPAWGKRGRHKGLFQGLPVNHINDYPLITRSQDFIDALKTRVEMTTRANVEKDINEHLKSMEDMFSNNHPTYTDQAYLIRLRHFAKHFKLQEMIPDYKKQFSRKATKDLQGQDLKDRINELRGAIRDNVTKRVLQRGDSVDLLRSLLNINLNIKEKLDKNKIELMIKDLQHVIATKFAPSGAPYDKNKPILEFMPNLYDNRPAKETLEELLKISREQNVDPNLIKYLQMLTANKPLHEIAHVSPPISPIAARAASVSSASAESMTVQLSSVSVGNVSHSPATQTRGMLFGGVQQSQPTSAQVRTPKTIQEVSQIVLNNLQSSMKISAETPKNNPNRIDFMMGEHPKVAKVTLTSQNGSLTLQEIPSPSRPPLESDGIKLIASAIIATGDQTPTISKGSAAKVVALLKELFSRNENIKPKINESVLKNLKINSEYNALVKQYPQLSQESTTPSTPPPRPSIS